MNKKQTAVEWLENELKDYLIHDDVKHLLEQAKAMERQQIIEAWIVTDNKLQRDAAEKYFTETYGELKT